MRKRGTGEEKSSKAIAHSLPLKNNQATALKKTGPAGAESLSEFLGEGETQMQPFPAQLKSTSNAPPVVQREWNYVPAGPYWEEPLLMLRYFPATDNMIQGPGCLVTVGTPGWIAELGKVRGKETARANPTTVLGGGSFPPPPPPPPMLGMHPSFFPSTMGGAPPVTGAHAYPPPPPPPMSGMYPSVFPSTMGGAPPVTGAHAYPPPPPPPPPWLQHALPSSAQGPAPAFTGMFGSMGPPPYAAMFGPLPPGSMHPPPSSMHGPPPPSMHAPPPMVNMSHGAAFGGGGGTGHGSGKGTFAIMPPPTAFTASGVTGAPKATVTHSSGGGGGGAHVPPAPGGMSWTAYRAKFRKRTKPNSSWEWLQASNGNAYKVQWHHILEHLYDYTTSGISGKPSHSFFPAGTTYQDVWNYLVEAVDNHLGDSNPVLSCGQVNVGWAPKNDKIFSFYLSLPATHPDRIDDPALTHLAGLL